uniref:Transmembrane protein 231 n=1 Tax=Culicoides sonorensis TaxID=179676 RepID=A0A336M9W9_CULSO
MKLFTVHKNPLHISYKHQLCSIATLFVILVAILVIVLPFVLIYTLYRDIWKQDLLIFEQPKVQFSYKYIFSAVLRNEATDNQKLVTCSSFSKYNELTENHQNCNGIKFIDFDHNHDQKTDELRFSFEFDTLPAYFVQSVSVLIQIDSEIESQCKFNVPAMIILEKHYQPQMISSNFTSMEVKLNGNLVSKQRRALVCPFFLRNIKSHFYYNVLDTNSSHIDDYSFEKIQCQLEMNPIFLKFEEENERKFDSKELNFKFELKVDVDDIMIRYQFTLWQIVNQIWIQYVAVLVVFYILGEKIKDYIFRNQYLAAWEVIPWRKLK